MVGSTLLVRPGELRGRPEAGDQERLGGCAVLFATYFPSLGGLEGFILVISIGRQGDEAARIELLMIVNGELFWNIN
uniref:Uncharacterized protein n=1 Tax=Rhizophora mucronata TaxID=61149 RepID=A0A2P2Q7M8_RHIMU